MSGNGKGREPDAFDNLDNLRLPPGATVPAPAGQPTKPRRDRVRARVGFTGFTKLPDLWKERLRGASGAVYGLAWELLAERWRSDKETFLASNALAARAGVSPRTKPRALAKLAYLGLVKVEQQGNQAPRVTVLHWKC